MSEQCQNTDKVLYREKHSDHWGSFDDSLFVTDKGGIGINVAGMVFVKPLKSWHSLEKETMRLKVENAKLNADIENLIWNLGGCSTFAMGYGLDDGLDKKMARPALLDVLKLALKARELKAKLSLYEEALKKCVGWIEPVLEGFSIKKDSEAYLGVLLFARQALSSGVKKCPHCDDPLHKICCVCGNEKFNRSSKEFDEGNPK